MVSGFPTKREKGFTHLCLKFRGVPLLLSDVSPFVPPPIKNQVLLSCLPVLPLIRDHILEKVTLITKILSARPFSNSTMTSLLELSQLKEIYKIKIIFITAFTKNYASSPVSRLLGSCQKYPHFDFAPHPYWGPFLFLPLTPGWKF